jgi:hypothetical protein
VSSHHHKSRTKRKLKHLLERVEKIERDFKRHYELELLAFEEVKKRLPAAPPLKGKKHI